MLFIAENPNPVGRKGDMERAPGDERTVPMTSIGPVRTVQFRLTPRAVLPA